MGAPKEYNGHRSWNAWNVAAWITNDEDLYMFTLDCITRAKRNPHVATRIFLRDGTERTPDGARYNTLSVRLAIESLIED